MFHKLVVFFYIFHCGKALFEVCESEGQTGRCQHIRDCPYAINLIHQNRRPKICHIHNEIPTVCCLKHLKHENHHEIIDYYPPNDNELTAILQRFLGNLKDYTIEFVNGDNDRSEDYEDSSARRHRRPPPPPPHRAPHPPLHPPPHSYPPPPPHLHPHLPPPPPLPSYPPFNPNEGPFTTTNSEWEQNRSTTTKNIATTLDSALNSNKKQIINSNNKQIDNNSPVSMAVQKCLKYYPAPHFHTFVTGGKKSLPKEYPHMALIGFGTKEDKQWLCGGSLISLKFVLTAGHCLYTSQFGDAKWVHLGDLDLSTDKDDAAPQDFNILKRIPHPEYEPPKKYHDIALLELDKRVKMSPYVAPACLQTSYNINDTTMSATGWGKTDFTGDSSSFLLQVELTEVVLNRCQDEYKSDQISLPNGINGDTQICAGGVKGKDTCNGDSGGPLQIKNPSRSFAIKVHTVVGVTSFGKACGLTPSPGVYTRVSYYVKWIEGIVWANNQD